MKKLFCVRIPETGDYAAVKSLAEAIHIAATINLAVLNTYNTNYGKVPLLFAVPQIWTGDEAMHEEDLKRKVPWLPI